MLVSSPENFARSRALGFIKQGMKTRHRRKAERMQPGDLMVYYITGVAQFAGAVTIESECFEESEPLWFTDGKPEEVYPWRVRTAPLCMPDGEAWMAAAVLRDQLRFVRKWPAKHWRLAFQGHVHELPDEDGRLIVRALRGEVHPGVSTDQGSTPGHDRSRI